MFRYTMRLLLASLACCAAFGQNYTISTFAGGGLPANIADTSATIYIPQTVAVDQAGKVFFSDAVENAAYRVDAKTGLLAVVAGNGTFGFSGDNGPATSAQVAFPGGVALDSAGNLYIADRDNYRVRKV